MESRVKEPSLRNKKCSEEKVMEFREAIKMVEAGRIRRLKEIDEEIRFLQVEKEMLIRLADRREDS
ncbi:hypothetical protein MUP77_10690 [Candidatus Bathyarchaeota archaeon]|nr:hypothetical protein [Candidatus Bathyarchaeota archaeon]